MLVNAIQCQANIRKIKGEWWPRLKYRTFYSNIVSINSIKLFESFPSKLVHILVRLFLSLGTVVQMEVLDGPVYKNAITL